MKYFYLFAAGYSACGARLPIDATPDWASNNRYAIEMRNDCNSKQSSIGLGGCAFMANEIGGNLILPSLWNGNVTFTSYNCNSFSMAASSSADNILPIKQLYTATRDNCSFQLTRVVSDSGLTADFPMTGRFMIKIIPANKFYSKLSFRVNDTSFSGIGWYQRKYNTADATITIHPSGTRGTFIARCGADEIQRFKYQSSEFSLALDSSTSCDYEFAAINEDSPLQEFATYMHEVSGYTVDLNVPVVNIAKNKISFQFNDRDSSGKIPVVVGVQVEQTKCIKTNRCAVPHNKLWYNVRGVTPSLRMFYGVYNSINQSWEIN